jgi:hypothetical protein
MIPAQASSLPQNLGASHWFFEQTVDSPAIGGVAPQLLGSFSE